MGRGGEKRSASQEGGGERACGMCEHTHWHMRMRTRAHTHQAHTHRVGLGEVARKRAVCVDDEEELCRIWIYPEEHAKWSGRVAEARDARTGEGGQETGQIQWDARRSLTWMKGGRKTGDAFLGGRMDWVPLGRGRMGRGCLPLHTHSRRVAGAR